MRTGPFIYLSLPEHNNVNLPLLFYFIFDNYNDDS